MALESTTQRGVALYMCMEARKFLFFWQVSDQADWFVALEHPGAISFTPWLYPMIGMRGNDP
jgi:hypothetical protein